jgi:potassium-transporting ATPase KdpC subunit
VRRQLVAALITLVIFTVLLGVGYPLLTTAIAQVAFNNKADGSLVTANGKTVGSKLIGQSFTDARGRPIRKYFQSRPSAATGVAGKTTAGYDPTLSSGSNYGPTDSKFLALVAARVRAYRRLNGLGPDVKVPVDAVTASASGLDPDISVANAQLQAARVARARGMPLAQVRRLIDAHTAGRTLGFLGEQTVNVLELNLALDAAARS